MLNYKSAITNFLHVLAAAMLLSLAYFSLKIWKASSFSVKVVCPDWLLQTPHYHSHSAKLQSCFNPCIQIISLLFFFLRREKCSLEALWNIWHETCLLYSRNRLVGRQQNLLGWLHHSFVNNMYFERKQWVMLGCLSVCLFLQRYMIWPLKHFILIGKSAQWNLHFFLCLFFCFCLCFGTL